jgi:hypothetical protein
MDGTDRAMSGLIGIRTLAGLAPLAVFKFRAGRDCRCRWVPDRAAERGRCRILVLAS